MRFSSDSDAELILSLLEDARNNPILRPVDQKKLKRKPRYKVKAPGTEMDTRTVSIPEPDEVEKAPIPVSLPSEVPATIHTEIQYYLLRLGSEMGLDIWAARNDRSRSFNGEMFASLPGMVSVLPTQFNEATQRTIELIDVLWLKGNSIIAAFEIESTTSVYSGLLRMSDLIALQPNLDIKLYLIADRERREKVRQEITRPTFELLQKPLSKVCGFITFETLRKKVQGIQDLGLASSIKPEFLEGIAEYFGKD